ncbi:MAG TPA: TetR/AcrR family transcriptional regulator [Candidatus Eubacterium avistercoris]|uniref:TetR/AcrR family transcriptional regulator n=1 Tax=Candidatus Eubacterium avistercoris TaxID=2838567 RepID=A0A9D2IGA6_9FIRM|nr:TetR/AcrR family transcriptional regulator [Candidatus Eubacterium avistercoris]
MGKKTAVSEATKQALQKAFWELYKNKSIEKISIREITERAGYNRGTFYLYYKDVYDMLEQSENQLIRRIYDSGLLPDGKNVSYDTNQLIAWILNIYQENFEKFKILLGTHGDPRFTKTLQGIMKKELACTLKTPEDINPAAANYYIEFVVSGILAVIVKWFSEGEQFPLDEFIRSMIHMLSPLSNVQFIE